MRARLAVAASGVRVELREILLRDKPQAFLETSPSATVPALAAEGKVLDESLDIMVWALKQNDPEDWLEMPEAGWDLIAECDGPFKSALDHTKYAVRFPDLDPIAEREKAAKFLRDLNGRLSGNPWLFGAQPNLGDFAMLPFVRQFANTDRPWFDSQSWADLIGWLDRFVESERFQAIMPKFAPWVEGQEPVWFVA